MNETSFDIAVIGGGPGGYVAAIRAAQLGFRVACVEKRATLGGTCLNVGCIPSKSLLESSHLYQTAVRGFATHGIVSTGRLGFQLSVMMERKSKIVADLAEGISSLFKRHDITVFSGTGWLIEPGKIAVQGEDESHHVLSAKHIILATGSEPASLPGIVVDEDKVVSSTGALSFKRPPRQLVVIGGGAIGLELGSIWRRLGSKVAVIECMDRILPSFDSDISREAQKTLENQGLEFRLNTKITEVDASGPNATLTMQPTEGGETETLSVDRVLVAVGRTPYTEGLGLTEMGVERDERGFIVVDSQFRTSMEGLYAIGDVIGGSMLAHKAQEEGIALAEILAGQAGQVNYEAVPNVVYTFPEIAMVGRTEEQLKADGVAYKTGRFPFSANARARTQGKKAGFVKLLADAETDRLLGAHIIGPNAGELINAATLGIEFSAAAEDIARTCHPHPGLCEAIREAALAVDGRAIHI